MHQPTILLFFISFVCTATATIRWHCGYDPNVIDWNNCSDDDYFACDSHDGCRDNVKFLLQCILRVLTFVIVWGGYRTPGTCRCPL
ncbi:hypothetical protein BST61_g5462 [Cercospora zeina]